MKKPLDPTKLHYRRRAVLDLYHPACGEFVQGDGSMTYPYRCKCGEWEFNADTNDVHIGYFLARTSMSLPNNRPNQHDSVQ